MGNSYLLFKGKVSDTHLMIVKNELDRAEAAGNMPDLKPLTSQLKSPILGLIISILFGFIGFDRFYKGDGGAGVLKFVLAVDGRISPPVPAGDLPDRGAESRRRPWWPGAAGRGGAPGAGGAGGAGGRPRLTGRGGAGLVFPLMLLNHILSEKACPF